ncbi:beta-propeller fold lactonase family protein [bacterium]|nr:beta-propeller fold lactonase family protein [bacterium]
MMRANRRAACRPGAARSLHLDGGPRMRRSPLILLTLLALMLAVPAGAADRALTDGFVGCSTSDDCYPFDLESGTPGAAIDLLPEGNYPYDATITPDGSQVWFVGASGDGVVVIDRATNGVVERFPVAEYLISIAFTADGSQAMITSRDEETISIVDTATYAVVGTLPMPTDYLGAGNIALDPMSGRLYVVDWYDETLYAVAADGSAVLDQAVLGDSLWQLVVAPDGDHVYVTDRGTDQVLEVATATLTITRTFTVGDDPWGIDIDADGSLLVVACEDSGEVHLIDLGSGTVTPIALDGSADPRDVDILDDAGLAYVAGGTVTGFSAPVYVIDLETGTVVDTHDGPSSNANVVAVQAQMHGTVTTAPRADALLALDAYPNPFNPQLTIELRLGAAVTGRLAVHDLAGRHVRTLATGPFAEGTVTARWDGRDAAGRAMPSGVYLVRLSGGNADVARKVVLAR